MLAGEFHVNKLSSAPDQDRHLGREAANPSPSARGDMPLDEPPAELVGDPNLLRQLLSPTVCRRLGVCRLPPDFLLSVVIPVYNEAKTVGQLVGRVRATGIPCEVIIVNDGSTDGTNEVLERLAGPPWLKVFTHASNRGKGAALRTGLAHVRGDVVVIQDADLEYDPQDYSWLMAPILEDRADVVYGSRFSSNDRPVWPFWHQSANRLITLLSNLCTNLKLTDVETCYKVMRRELIEAIGPTLQENGFGVELEITAKLARHGGVRFYERPISYRPRSYAEGKKIRSRDALRALWCILRY
jgi:glycosyltransferase involved in cell wall biosynthesis